MSNLILDSALGWEPDSMFSRAHAMMRDLQSELNNAARLSFVGRLGCSDFEELPDQYLLEVDVPGIDKSDISVKVVGRLLHVSGVRKNTRAHTQMTEEGTVNVNEESKSVIKERYHGSFKRTIQLPDDAVAKNIDARIHNGVLTISIPRSVVPDQAHDIPVN